MIPQRLSEEERRIVEDPSDIIYLEIVKGMSVEEMSAFDCYRPKDFHHYTSIQKSWIQKEMYLIMARPGHDSNTTHDSLQGELAEDMISNRNGPRFKTFYVLKFPEMVERISN